MKIKNFVEKTTNFLIKRLSELVGIIILGSSILLFVSLVSYSPEDPNFIFPENVEIKNLLGAKGSYVSDFLYQSIGFISLLVPVSFILISLSVIIDKKILYILESLFFIILYSITGALFFTVFHTETYWLTINGNNGFLGNLFEETFFVNLINLNRQISYFILIILISLFFLLSINFKINHIKFVIKIFSKSKKEIPKSIVENYNENSLSETDYVKNETRIQENFTFEKNNDSPGRKIIKYKLPSLEFLKIPTKKDRNLSENKIDEKTLEKILLDFGVEGEVKKVSQGPVVTLYEFEPAPGVKVSKIINLSEDIARNTSSESARIATIPGSNTIGIELPKPQRENVFLSEIISDSNFKKKDTKLPIALGKSISGIPITGDLSTMPHLLIAGTTGSGKSVCINTIILSLLYKHSPEKCKFILIDPKMLELSTYEGIPHLLCPVITEAKKAASVLGWVVKEMENRYKLMTKVGVRNIDGYNEKHKISMPYIVVIVDEMSDLMLVAGKDIENYIQKLSQMARAAGIHIIMATQRPEGEIEKINNFLRNQAEPDYVDEILNFADEKERDNVSNDNENLDELYNTALEIVRSERKASTSFLQRKLQIGYNRAARIVDQMEANGVVSPANHVGKREVLK